MRRTRSITFRSRGHSGTAAVIVGFGPAGMFAALVLSMAGLRPLVLERRQDARRGTAVLEFWKTGTLGPRNYNVQFGEERRGAFSDRKLSTGVKTEGTSAGSSSNLPGRVRAPISSDAKPHIGTDELVTVVQNLRETIIHYGGEVRFGVKVTGLVTGGRCVTGGARRGRAKRPSSPASCCVPWAQRDTF